MRLKPNLSTRNESSNEGAEYYVLGGGDVGASVARRLQANGHSVTLVDETHDSTEIPNVRDDPRDVQALADAGISDASTVVVTTPHDSQNLLIAQLVRAHFDVPKITVLVNAPARCDLFAEVGHAPVCATTALSDAVVANIEEVKHDLSQTA